MAKQRNRLLLRRAPLMVRRARALQPRLRSQNRPPLHRLPARRPPPALADPGIACRRQSSGKTPLGGNGQTFARAAYPLGDPRLRTIAAAGLPDGFGDPAVLEMAITPDGKQFALSGVLLTL